MGYFRGKGLAAVAPVVALLREIGGRYAKSPAQVAGHRALIIRYYATNITQRSSLSDSELLQNE